MVWPTTRTVLYCPRCAGDGTIDFADVKAGLESKASDDIIAPPAAAAAAPMASDSSAQATSTSTPTTAAAAGGVVALEPGGSGSSRGAAITAAHAAAEYADARERTGRLQMLYQESGLSVREFLELTLAAIQ